MTMHQQMTGRLFGPFAPVDRGKRAGSREGVAPSGRHGLDLPKRCWKGQALLRLCWKGQRPSEALLKLIEKGPKALNNWFVFRF